VLSKLKPKSEFTRNVLTLMTGSMIAQAIPIAISPILTRIYTPKDFGIFALYMSVASLLATFATGRYELAIMLPKKDEDALTILSLSLIISFIISFLSLLFIVIFNENICNLLGNNLLSNWLYLIPISVLFTGLYQSFNYWNNRRKYYKTLAISRVSVSATTGTSNLSLGASGFGASGLIISTLLGQIVSTLVLAKSFYKVDRKLLKNANKVKLIALMKKYKKFPLLNLPNAVIDSFRLSGINMLIAKYFTTGVLGQFSLAWKMVQVPIILIGGSLGQVFFQKISSIPKSDIYLTIITYIKKASFISAPIFLVIYLFSKDIFGFVFGEEWILAGESASIMAPWLFINFVSSPLVAVMLILNKQEYVLIFSIFYMLIPLLLIINLYSYGFIYTLIQITLAMSILLLLFSMVIIYQAKKEQI